MKKSLLILLVLTAAFVGCKQVEGPMGPEGPTGPAGEDGEDATVTCYECHNSTTTIYAAELQWANSVHATGTAYERSGSGCSSCHTNEGFHEMLETGSFSTSAVSNPTNVSCYTCHFVHKNNDSTDLDLRTTAAVTALSGDGVTFNFGNSNLCLNCHQNWSADATLTATSTDSITIASSRWGGHHGASGPIFAGEGLYEVSGSANYSNTNHTASTSCIGCHMADAFGGFGGGHSMNMFYDYHGSETLNYAACESCHDDEDALELDMAASEYLIDSLHTQLGDTLVAKGLLTAGTYSYIQKKVTAEQARVLFNWKSVSEDLGAFVHNPKYVRAILINSVETASAW
jgi:hypothetical protein